MSKPQNASVLPVFSVVPAHLTVRPEDCLWNSKQDALDFYAVSLIGSDGNELTSQFIISDGHDQITNALINEYDKKINTPLRKDRAQTIGLAIDDSPVFDYRVNEIELDGHLDGDYEVSADPGDQNPISNWRALNGLVYISHAYYLFAPGEGRSRVVEVSNEVSANSRYTLGVIFATGQGVVKDNDVAKKWFRFAAELGHAESIKWLEAEDKKKDTVKPEAGSFLKKLFGRK